MDKESGRPKKVPQIYKNGAILGKKGLLKLSFNELLNQCKPMSHDTFLRIKQLVKDVEVDLDKPLNPNDD